MYGLSQAEISVNNTLVNNKLKDNLVSVGYALTTHTSGLWKHKSKNLVFSLCVDDFFIKYVNVEDVRHLLDALQTMYTISIDWEDKLYC